MAQGDRSNPVDPVKDPIVARRNTAKLNQVLGVVGGASDGSVVFISSGVLTGASTLFWDAVNERLGVGTVNPIAGLDTFKDARFNSEAGDNDFTVLRDTSGNAIFYDASLDAWDFNGNIIFNQLLADKDFTIKKSSSGNAYRYDAGLDQHEFSETVLIGLTTKDASALFEIGTTTKGSVPQPPQTEVQRDAIGTPKTALHVYNTDDKQLNWFDGNDWRKFLGDIYQSVDTVGGTNPNSATPVQIPFDDTTFIEPWIVDTSDTLKTIQTAGDYVMAYFVEVEKGNASSVILESDIAVNGTPSGLFSDIEEVSGNSFTSFRAQPARITLAANDTLEVEGFRVSGNTGVCSVIADSTRFTIQRVG